MTQAEFEYRRERARVAVATRFGTLLDRISLLPSERERYATHRTTVTGRLVSTFDDCRVEVIGSHSRDTALRGRSDLDLMAHLPRAVAVRGGRWIGSDRVLMKVREELEYRFVSTDIRKDSQAVTIRFADQVVDVVPAIFLSFSNTSPRFPIFAIPDGMNWWLETSPAVHSRYISDANERSGGKLRNVVRLLKYWRTLRAPEVPILSFHLEMIFAEAEVFPPGHSLSWCVDEAFSLLVARGLRGLQDPVGISGVIPGAMTEAKQRTALASIERAASHSRAAWNAEANGDTQEALRQWDLVFYGSFPA